MLILGIETSCDETAAAIVKDGVEIISSVVASSSALHLKTGGVIPEVAARKQLEYIISVISQTFETASLKFEDLDSIAVTYGPGLIGALVVGVETAKALAAFYNKPLIPVNHLIAHLYGNFIAKDLNEITFPCVVLIVSGGHTDLVLMKGHGDFEYIGGTLDDACGEAFDKVARALGLSAYFGGPHISKAASKWKPVKSSTPNRFKRPMIDSKDFNFSFSGTKTAVMNKIIDFRKAHNLQFTDTLPEEFVNEIAYEFQEAVTDVLVHKTSYAAKKHDVKTILIAGGVAANSVLREKLETSCKNLEYKLFVPPLALCSDTAITIASCAYFNPHQVPLETIKADPSLTIMS